VYEVPELQVSEIRTEDHCYPTSSAVVNGDINTGAESKIRLPAQLTHLNFLPRTLEQNDGTLPTIQAIFSTPPNIVSFDQTQPQQNPFSILVRWQIHQTQQNQLHSSLEKVTSKKKSVSSIPGREVFLFKKMPDIIMHSVVMEFYPLWYNMILAFCHSDGTIEFRKRATMDSIVPDFNTETVTSLPQAGFGFPSTDPSLHIALSPNYCLAACMHQDGTIKLRSMEYSYGNLSSTDPDSRHSAALAALVLQSSTAANQYFSSDDIFSIIHTLSIPSSRVTDFIALLFQGLNVNIDCGVDDSANNHLMLLGRSPFFVKTLSAAHLLGLSGTVERTIPSKLAWMILNIKYITQILTTIARMHGQIDKTPLRPEVVPQFVGICRWIMHFMVYILDDILALAFDLRNSSPDTTSNSNGNANIDINKAIHAKNHPAILLLLSSFPRMMLKLWSQPLAWVVRTAYQYSSSSHPQANIPAELRRVYAPLHQALSDLPFDWRLFESLVSEAHALVRGTYRARNIPEAERNHVERQLILGHIPDLLLPVAKRLLGESIFGKEDSADPSAQQQPCLADKIDIGRVMFFDTIWLGLSTSNISKRFHGTHIVDVCQKTVIRGVTAQNPPGFTSSNNNGASSSQPQQSRGRSDTVNTLTSANGGKLSSRPKKMRRCVRCGAYMEDVVQGMPGYANHHISWLMGVAKHCVCGNSWMLVDDVTSSMLMDGFKGKAKDKANGMSRGLPMGSALDGNWGD
jgi:mediator of RNA polymerase II transcription subunit 16